MKEITFDRFIRSLVAIVIVALIYFLLRRLSNVLTPFFLAWLAAYMLYPFVCFFQYRCKLRSRVLSIIVTLVVALGVLALAGWLIIPPVAEEVTRLKEVIVSYVSQSSEASDLPNLFKEYVLPYLDWKYFSKNLTFADITSILEERIPQVISIVSGSINALIGFVASLIAIIYMFFILMDYENMSKGFIKLVPQGQRKFVSGMLHDVEKGMNSYFRGQSLIAFCVGILFSIGFLIIDFPMAIPLGLFIGCLNLVPYLQVVGFIPTMVLALLKAHDTGESIWMIALGVVAVFLIVQAIQDWVLTPRIMGHVTGLNAAVILLSLSVWGSLLGFVGLIIALPLTTLIFSYYKRYVLHENDDLADTAPTPD